MSAGLTLMIKNIALKEAIKEPISKGNLIKYTPSNVLIILASVMILIGLLFSIYTVLNFQTDNFYPLLFISFFFLFFGILFYTYLHSLTVYRLRNIIYKKTILGKKVEIKIEDITKISNNELEDFILIFSSSNKIHCSKYLRGISFLIKELEEKN